MKVFLKSVIIIMLLSQTLSFNAQTFNDNNSLEIKGKVVDEKGFPLVAKISIIINNDSIITYSDIGGKFVIQFQSNEYYKMVVGRKNYIDKLILVDTKESKYLENGYEFELEVVLKKGVNDKKIIPIGLISFDKEKGFYDSSPYLIGFEDIKQ